MSIRGYFSPEHRELASPGSSPLEQPYLMFSSLNVYPRQDIAEKVHRWTIRETFSSRDGYHFTPGRYRLRTRRGSAASMTIDAQTTGDEVRYEVNGWFHTWDDMSEIMDRLKYGMFPHLRLSFAFALFLDALRLSLGFKVSELKGRIA